MADVKLFARCYPSFVRMNSFVKLCFPKVFFFFLFSLCCLGYRKFLLGTMYSWGYFGSNLTCIFPGLPGGMKVYSEHFQHFSEIKANAQPRKNGLEVVLWQTPVIMVGVGVMVRTILDNWRHQDLAECTMTEGTLREEGQELQVCINGSSELKVSSLSKCRQREGEFI